MKTLKTAEQLINLIGLKMKNIVLITFFLLISISSAQTQQAAVPPPDEDPPDGPNISSVLPIITHSGALNTYDNQSVTVSISKLNLDGYNYTLTGVKIIVVQGTGMSNYTFTSMAVSTFSHTYTNVPDNQLVKFKIEATYSGVSPAIRYTGINQQTVPDRTPPANASFSASDIEWYNESTENTGDNQVIRVHVNLPSGADYIKVFAASIAGAANQGVSNSGNVTSYFDDTGVYDNQTIAYRIQAFDNAGNYSSSTTGYTKVIGNRTPPANSNSPTLQWVSQGSNSGDNQHVKVTFTKATGVTKVQVLKVSGTGTDNSIIYTANGYYTDTGVADEQTVSYKLRSYDNDNNYVDSPLPYPTVAIGDRTAPSVPSFIPADAIWTNEFAYNNGDNQIIQIHYSGNDPDFNESIVVYRNNSAVSGNLYNVSGNWFDNNVADQQTVIYKLRRYDDNNNFSESGEQSIVIGDRTPPTASNTPSIVWNDQGLNSANTQQVTVTFSLAAGIDHVQVIPLGVVGGSNSTNYTGNGSYVDTGVSDQQFVKYKLRSYDAAGNYMDSSPSNIVELLDRTPPAITTPLIYWQDQGLNTGDNQKVNVTYYMPVDGVSAEITSTGSGTNGKINATSSSTYIDENVGDNQTASYTYTVTDATGNTGQVTVNVSIPDRTPPADFNYSMTKNSMTFYLTASTDSYSSVSLQWQRDGINFGGPVNLSQVNNQSKTMPDQLSAYSAKLTFTDAAGNSAIFTTNLHYLYTVNDMDNLAFDYYPNSNQVKRVVDAVIPSAFPKDFDSDPAATHYTYDANGNMNSDKNRGISSIVYNHLNLPVQINKTDNSHMEYDYDANGRRREKRVYDINSNLVDKSVYIRDHEGLVITELNRFNKMKYRNLFGAGNEIIGQHYYHYDGSGNLLNETDYYYLKDHLGNIRKTIEPNATNYLFQDDFENGNSWTLWTAYNNSFQPAASVETDPDDATNQAVRLRNNRGTTRLTKIFNVGENRHYKIRYRVKIVDAAQSYNNLYLAYMDDNDELGDYIQTTVNTSNSNWQTIEYNFTTPAENDQIGGTSFNPVRYDGQRVEIALRIHSSPTLYNDVYFDDIELIELDQPGGSETVTRVVSEFDYYPYGMVMRETINAPATDETAKYKYQGKERDLETGYDYFEARLYDSAIGRFMQVDPLAEKFARLNGYNGMGNNPIIMSDISGLAPDITIYGANNSSVTIRTDLVDISADVSGLGLDFGGNYSIGGEDVVMAGLDIVGIVDPTGIADITSAGMSLSNGDYWGAAASAVGAGLPFIGDLAKGPKIAKGVEKIGDAIGDAKKFGGGADTSSKTAKQAFRNAKDQNGIPRSQQPNSTTTVKEKGTGKPLKQYEFTNSKGEKVSIRKDNPKTYKDGGQQGKHYNAGKKDEKLKQHHDYEN